MKVLKNAKFTGNIKINDTNTDIYFQAYDDGVLQKLNAGQCSFRIKNDTGYLITISNVSTETDYITFKSNELKPLPVGTYYLELWVEDSTGTYIYPDESFCKLRINENVTVAQGTTIPTISLDEYENKLQGYVDTAVADGTQKIESDFDKYVDSITDSTIATATKASQDAATAINTANSANATAQNATNIANAAKSNADGAAQNASTALDTANTAKSTANSASQTASNAQTVANEAKSTADIANSTASSANSSATDALNKANSNYALISPSATTLFLGGTNLLWGTSASSTKLSGEYNLTSSSNNWLDKFDQLGITNGDVITYSVYIDSTNVQLYLHIEFYDANGGWVSNADSNFDITAGNSGWLTLTTTVPNNASQMLHFIRKRTNSDSDVVFARKEKMELGAKRTDWNMSAIEIKNKLDSIQQTQSLILSKMSSANSESK